MEITLYSEFTKRRNSTKNPASPGAISVSVDKTVTLKGECDYIRPSFFISDVTGFVYLKAWNMYYYIKNVKYDINGAQYIVCEIDVLGTWRDVIMNTYAFVKYSTSNYNVFIRDDRIATTGKMISKSVHLDMSNWIGSDYSDKFENHFLLTCYTQTGLKTYLLNTYGISGVIQQLIQGGEDFFGSIEQQFADARDSIVSLKVCPFKPSAIETNGTTEKIFLGNFNTDVEAEYVTSYLVQVNDGIPLTEINRSDFKVLEPYTYAKLYMPLVGVVDFSIEEIQNAGALLFMMYANIITGRITYIFYVGSGNVEDDTAKIIGIYDSTFGFELPIATSAIENPIGFVTSLAKSTAAIGAAGVAGAAFASAMTPVAGVALAGGLATYIQAETATISNALKQNVSITGGFSGNFGWNACKRIKLEVFTPEVTEDADNLRELYGRPLCQVKRIGDLTGYVETKGFSIDISALEDIKHMINVAMDSGVYLE